ncbi:MAG: hypothetical protein WD733_03450 [Bryobacterales bacterium]
MSQHGHSPNGHTHEKSDASTQPLFRFVVGLAVFVAAAMVVMGMLYSYFGEREAALDAPLSPLAKQQVPLVVSGPQLQPNPTLDLGDLRRQEEAQLNGYGWVDQPAGLVRIPVERAIELMAERGLPARSAPPAAQ